MTKRYTIYQPLLLTFLCTDFLLAHTHRTVALTRQIARRSQLSAEQRAVISRFALAGLSHRDCRRARRTRMYDLVAPPTARKQLSALLGPRP